MGSSRASFLLIVMLIAIKQSDADLPCAAARFLEDESVVCICNSTYCDSVTRSLPYPGSFSYYASSRRGQRFDKKSGRLVPYTLRKIPAFDVTLAVDLRTQYQTIEGFGGAVTDAAGINWRSLSAPLQERLVDAYFGEVGIEYNMVRVPIGGSDFSTRPYAYNESPCDDTGLSNFSLSYEDYHFKLPMINAAQRAARAPLHVLATVWSPPPWMKTNDEYAGYSRLKPEFYQTFADYYYKFIEAYAAQGVRVWGITTTNEPTNGLIPLNYFNSLGWTANSMGKWIVNHLGPKIRNSSFSDVKIIAGDDQRATLPYWISRMIHDEPHVLDYVDGVGVHYYSDFITPAEVLSHVMRPLHNKFLLATEACEGSFPWQHQKVLLGSWQRAYSYISDIITDLNFNAVGWLDWNLCLSMTGGPNWARNYVDSPIIVYPEKDVFIKQPMYYAMGHFSKFLPRGSRRVRVLEHRPLLPNGLEYVGFFTPSRTVVVIFYNRRAARTVNVLLGDKMASVSVDADSIVTVELPVL